MIRCGIGYDVHRLATGRRLILGGVEIAHSRGLEGHSDADVLSHAIADALLGAIGAGDIGRHFPNTDESILDATILAEAPKIAPYIPAMRKAIARAIGSDESRIGIKATTNEGLGAIGRSEGIAAMAIATVEQE